MNDWDDHLDEVMGAYNSTRHASTGYSPHLLLTGQEKSIPLSFLYPEFGAEEFEDQSSYLKSVVQRLQEIHELVRRNMHQAQLRQKRQFDRGVRGKPFQVDELVWVFCRVIPKGGSAKLLRGWRGPYKVVEVLQEGRLYVLSSGHKVHFERLKRHISGPQEWKVLGGEEDDDEIVADPNPEDPVEEVASDVEEGSFVEEQRLSDAADELSEWGPASDSHPMQTRTRTALQEGRPRRRFEQYADYSSSDEQSVEVPDVRLPQKDNADDLFMEDLYRL